MFPFQICFYIKSRICITFWSRVWKVLQNKRKNIDNNNNNNDKYNRIQRCNSRISTVSSLRREPTPARTFKWPGSNRVQITCNTSSAHHVQHIMLRATWYEGTAQLLSMTELKSHLFEIYFIGWTINRWRGGGRKPDCSEKTPGTSFRNLEDYKSGQDTLSEKLECD